MNRRMLAALMAGTVAVAGTVASGNPAVAQPRHAGTQAVAQAFDGQSLYEGLTFGIGPVAARYPGLALNKQAVSPTLAAKIHATTTLVAQRDPALFSTFQAAVTSGNPYRAADAVQAANKAFAAAGAQTGVVASDSTVGGDCIVVVVVAAGAVVVAAVVYKVKVKTSVAPQGGGALAQQEWIQRVVTTLG